MMAYMTINNVKYEVVRSDTRTGESIIAMCDRYEGYSLDWVYDKWSRAKQNVFDYWEDTFLKMNDAWNFHICSHNSHIFTLGWYAKINGKIAFVYITPTHNYIVI